MFSTLPLPALGLALLLATGSPLAPPHFVAQPKPPRAGVTDGNAYRWLTHPYHEQQTLAARFAPPAGCQRVAAAPNSFAEWLRHLPLRPKNTPVYLHNGRLKTPQTVHAAVLDIDTGPRDLQQCADAVMRLRAEYQFTRNYRQIHFHLTSGHDIWFGDWVEGRGFRVQGEEVLPAPRAAEAPTHAALRRYLDQIFTYAGSLSLSRELRRVPLNDVQPGDVFIKGGAPGHAVMVLDVAEHATTKRRYALLAQSYMPAQDMHVLRNRPGLGLGAWFLIDPAAELIETPEWDFTAAQLMRWQ
ncbi:DUF4846 domain-containing protein [Hymenobacter latericus]|uniref:DUF4846 domain-containing protein n=1 Tax=Hymenobacter sp. YIM 151858-1 TaxID=2987688 RepID=UPI0022266736|nr:DUF4846 domain-containing protein [Hymenobacter sp. YIM 151858-1]UYZ60531.1 DUF4846 domain-containing protein [Hymenobacter sp. YIM 151858-1]